MISITPKCFGTKVPSTGNLRTQKSQHNTLYFRYSEVECWTCEFCVRKFPIDGTLVPKYVGVILIMNCFNL